MKSTKDSTPETQGRWNTFWYERPMLDVGRITFSRLELKNEDDMKSKFLIFWQHIMFPWIDIVASFFGDQGYLINF